MRCGPVRGLSAAEEHTLLATHRRDSSLPCLMAEDFFRRFEPFIIQVSRNLSRDALTQAELYQEGGVAAFEALRSFRAEAGVRLSTHVLNSVRWRMLKCRRHERRRCLSYGDWRNPRLTSLDAVLPAGDEDGNEVHVKEPVEPGADACPRTCADRSLLAAAVGCAMQCLSPKQRAAVDLVYLQEVRPSDAAERLGVSRPRATQLVNAGLEKLRGALAPAWAA